MIGPVILVASGLIVVAIGIVFLGNWHGITRATHDRVLWAWDSVPGGQKLYRWAMPYPVYRAVFTAFVVMGAALVSLGIAKLL